MSASYTHITVGGYHLRTSPFGGIRRLSRRGHNQLINNASAIWFSKASLITPFLDHVN